MWAGAPCRKTFPVRRNRRWFVWKESACSVKTVQRKQSTRRLSKEKKKYLKKAIQRSDSNLFWSAAFWWVSSRVGLVWWSRSVADGLAAADWPAEGESADAAATFVWDNWPDSVRRSRRCCVCSLFASSSTCLAADTRWARKVAPSGLHSVGEAAARLQGVCKWTTIRCANSIWTNLQIRVHGTQKNIYTVNFTVHIWETQVDRLWTEVTGLIIQNDSNHSKMISSYSKYLDDSKWLEAASTIH